MNPTPAANIAALASGKLISGDENVSVLRVVTDSRIVQSGDLFVALHGPQFDAHTFIPDVIKRGASAVMVSREVTADIAVILVKDTILGLQALAKNYRSTLKCHVVGITGSNGKTSTKDFAAAVFGGMFSVSKTQGNLNNHIGLPLSVLAVDDSNDVAILEMGMNHPGEIAPLAEIAAANAAIITNIGTAHIEFMKTQAAIAAEKAELARSVSSKGIVFLNANDLQTPAIKKMCQAKVITAGIDAGDVSAYDLEPVENGTAFTVAYRNEKSPAFLPFPGHHMVGNAMLALAAGLAHGIPLADAVKALKDIQLTAGRLQSRQIAGIHFLDDTYNANPDSVLAALTTLEEVPASGKRVAVLGAMGELGEHSEAGHRRVGAASQDVDLLVTVGKIAGWIAEEAEKLGVVQVLRTEDTSQAAAALLSLLQPGDCVLVKGSRSARMERVIQDLELSLQPIPSTRS